MRKEILLAGTAIVAMSAGSVASAQYEDTIIVQASKRDQTLQEVPIAVSVVDSEVIQKAQINDIIDLQSVIPSLRVSQLQQSGNVTYLIRGFGNGANNSGIEPSVGVFVDGVYRSRSSASVADLPGVERVEVLRGPQSTLFGKNASAGIISFVTAEPSFFPEGSAEMTIGNYNQFIAKGYKTGPLTDTVAYSLAGTFNMRDGYVENGLGGDDLNDRNRWAVRGQLLAEPTDNLKFRVIADYDTLDENCCYAPYIQAGPLSQAFFPLGATALADDPFAYEAFIDRTVPNSLTNYGVSGHIDYDLGWGQIQSISSYRRQTVESNGDVDFGPVPILASNLLDNEFDTFTQEVRLIGSTDKLDYVAGAFYFNEKLNNRGHIINDSLLRPYAAILAGGGDPVAGEATIAGLESVFNIPSGTIYGDGIGSFEEFEQENQSVSLFAQGDYAVTDRLTATLGVAYTYDKKEVEANVVGTDPFYAIDLTQGAGAAGIGALVFAGAFTGATNLPATPANINAVATNDPQTFAAIQAGAAAATPGSIASLSELQFIPPFQNFPNAIEDGESEDDKVTYIARLAYDLADFVNVYGSYATGFKASSWNLSRDSDPFPDDFATLVNQSLLTENVDAGSRFAGPEETTVWELGLKASFDKGSINVTYFDQTIEGFQTAIFSGTGFNFANAGEQSATGLEIEGTFRPWEPLSLTFAGTFLDPEYVEFVGGQVVEGSALDALVGEADDGVGDLSGQAPAGIHETSLYFGAQYEHLFDNGLEGFVRADYQYESDVQIVDNVSEDLASREVNVVNASAGLNWENGLGAFIWVRNLTEDEYLQSAFPTTIQPGSFSAYPNQPRTYGVTVRKDF